MRLQMLSLLALGLMIGQPVAAQASDAPTAASTKAGVAPGRVGAADSAATAMVAQMKVQLRNLMVTQEVYWSEHGTYTTDLAALGFFNKDQRPPRESAFVQVIFAGGRGWSGMASHRGLPGKICVVYVGSPDELPRVPVTSADKRPAQLDGLPTCDTP